MKMTELCSDWLFGYYALGRGKFFAKTISINNFSSERVDSKDLYGGCPGNGLLLKPVNSNCKT